MKDLIHNDISRCNDYKCPIGAFCARFRQLRFDKENGNTQMSVTDFKGREKKGLCDYFLNAADFGDWLIKNHSIIDTCNCSSPNRLREAAKKYFEEELSGEPLCQDSVVDWLTEYAQRLLKAEKDDYTLVTDAKNEPKEFINDNRLQLI